MTTSSGTEKKPTAYSLVREAISAVDEQIRLIEEDPDPHGLGGPNYELPDLLVAAIELRVAEVKLGNAMEHHIEPHASPLRDMLPATWDEMKSLLGRAGVASRLRIEHYLSAYGQGRVK